MGSSTTKLVFEILANSAAAVGVLDDFGERTKKLAGIASAAFGAMALGKAFNDSLNEGQIEANFKAQIAGIPADTEEIVNQAVLVYRDGWGSSLKDVTDAMKAVQGHLGDLGSFAPGTLNQITEGALSLSQAFGVSVNDSMQAVSVMVKNKMAPDAMSALDIITHGMQTGSNAAGDFLSTLTTYGPSFQEMGIDGTQATDMINKGLQAGAPSAAVAMKGFQTLMGVLAEGHPKASGMLEDLGIHQADFSAAMKAGGETAREMVGKVITAMSQMNDPTAEAAMGAAVFGKAWRRSSDDIIFAMNPAKASIDDVTGATDALGATMHDTAQTKVDDMKRHFEGWMMDVVGAPGPIGTLGAALVAFGGPVLQFGGSVAMLAVALKGTAAWAVLASGMEGLAAFAGSIVALGAAAGPVLAVLVAMAAYLKWIIDHKDQILNTPWNALHSSDKQGAKDYFSGPLVAHASGGVVMPRIGGQAILAGEAGEPEAVVPLSKWDQMTGGNKGGGVTVNVNVNGFAMGTSADLARSIVDTLNREARRGSIPANALAGVSG